ncbi:MAG: hypothetical protein P9L99_05475 [Candidatus Lernaella stagnicola]|nr:hypothetical protein [Candidatus Lernaella stagnicola]
MVRKSWLLFALALFVAFTTAHAAHAATYNVNFCFELEVDYGSTVSQGDYWINNSDKVARGIRAKISENGGDVVYLAYVDEDTGCTPTLSLSSTESYQVRLYSHSRVSYDNTVKVYIHYPEDVYHQQTVDWAFVPSFNGTAQYTYEIINNVHETNILAAASYAVDQRRAGLSEHNFYFYTQDCPSGGSCMSNGRIFLDAPYKDGLPEDKGRNSKFTIIHELGHLIGWKRDGDQSAVCNYGDQGENNCLSIDHPHHMDSREYQTAAAVEGNAHFYAAAIWNDKYDNDCRYKDYDCESPGILANKLGGCDGTHDNRGVEWDWLNFWWDMHSKAGLSVSDIFDIWDGANPHDWVASSVYKRLRDAALDEGVYKLVWVYWAGRNGVTEGTWE